MIIRSSHLSHPRALKFSFRKPWILLPLLTLFCAGCSNLFFYPSHNIPITPDKLGISYKELLIQQPDKTPLTAWLLIPPSKPKGLILFLHGNAQNIGHHLASVYWLPKEGYSVLLVDYHGFGKTKGAPSIAGINADSLAAARYAFRLKDELGAKRFVIFGQSLGGAAALYLAAQPEWRNKFDAVVAESSFSSYPEVFKDKASLTLPTAIIGYPLSLTIPSRFDPLPQIEKISPTPLLLIYHESDPVVLSKHSKALYAAAKEPKTIKAVNNGDHIGALFIDDYRKDFLRFISGSQQNEQIQQQRTDMNVRPDDWNNCQKAMNSRP